ncbi:MAG: hypothetical protein IPL87_01140 [Candidatus Moraniibacteriota bacterium]|nr:MAG: hypothetical protein IPL87_01140 [Candidatus Moranbacteria bacterium]
MFTPKEIEEIQALFLKEFGMKLSEVEAARYTEQFLNLLRETYKVREVN